MFEPLYTPGGFRATTPTAAETAARLPEGPAWIATIDGKPVGTVAAVCQGEEIYVRSMAVTPAARGAGVAQALLDAVTHFAIDGGARRMRLSTTPFLQGAIRLYERTGFRRLPQPLDLAGTPLFARLHNKRSVHTRAPSDTNSLISNKTLGGCRRCSW